MIRFALIAVVLGSGCAVKEKTSTGPTITVTLLGPFDQASDSDPTPSLEIDTTEPSSSVMMQVDANDGTVDEDDKVSTVHTTSLAATLSLGGVALPASTFTTTEFFESVQFDRAAPIVLAPSAVGKTLVVHVIGTDANGLHSNVIDLNVAIVSF